MMETQNKGLDSVKRRRVLAEVLKIPPVLLGLGSIADLEQFLKGQQKNTSPASGISSDTITLYRDALTIYSKTHSVSTVQSSLPEIENWIKRIGSDVGRTQGQQQIVLKTTLWGFHSLTAKVYGDDLSQWRSASSHLDAAIELATQLRNPDYLAASFYRSAQLQFARRNRYLAKADLDRAIAYAKDATTPHIKGAVFSSAGLAYALLPSDLAEKTYAKSLLNKAEPFVSNKDHDDYIIRFDTGKFLLEKAEALLNLGSPVEALEVLDDAEEKIDTTQTRRRAYIDILHASAYMKMKRPQWDAATDLLTSAFALSKSVKSEFNIGCISRLFSDVKSSPFGNATSVARLGLALNEWRKGR